MPILKTSDLQLNKEVPGENADDKTLLIEPDPAKKLPTGEYVFQLVVTDDANNVSDPATIRVVVADRGKPVAIINGPKTVAVGEPIPLNGAESKDPDGGKLTKFVWTLVKTP